MKAAVLYDTNDIRYEEVAAPTAEGDEVIIRVRLTGICGSDLPRVLGTAAHFCPIVLGHEFSGDVAEVGRGVDGFSKGDRVTGAPLLPCFSCSACLKGKFAQCSSYSFVGSRTSGSWAEFVKLPAANVLKVPADVSHRQATFVEPLTVAFHGLLTMGFRPGTEVAIIGMGSIGLLTLQCARVLGARRTMVFDIDDRRLQIAKELGADVCLNTLGDQFEQRIEAVTRGGGFEQVIETAGVEFTEKLSLEIAANHGQVLFIGTPSKSITLTPAQFEDINRKELTVRGSWMSYSAPFPGQEWELALHYLQTGQIVTSTLIDRVIPLHRIREAMDDLAMPGNVTGKVLLEP